MKSQNNQVLKFIYERYMHMLFVTHRLDILHAKSSKVVYQVICYSVSVILILISSISGMLLIFPFIIKEGLSFYHLASSLLMIVLFFHSRLFLSDKTLDIGIMHRSIFISFLLNFHSLKDYILVITTENLFLLISCSSRRLWATLILLCVFNNGDQEKVIYCSMPSSFHFIKKQKQ